MYHKTKIFITLLVFLSPLMGFAGEGDPVDKKKLFKDVNACFKLCRSFEHAIRCAAKLAVKIYKRGGKCHDQNPGNKDI